jgi:thioesterase domain-containing protein
LGLVDSFIVADGGDVPPELDRQRFASGARQYLEQLGLALPVAEEELARHEPAEQIALLLDELRAAGMDIPDAVKEQTDNLLKIWKVNAAAAVGYRPQPYDGPVALFRATEVEADATGRAPDAAAQWAAVSRGALTVYDIAGSHTSIMLRPEHLDVLAARLGESLATSHLGQEAEG